MSQTPNNLDQGIFAGTPAGPAYAFATRKRPEVKPDDDRGSWRRFSDWIFDGILPGSQTNSYGEGDPERRQSLQEKTQRDKMGGKPFIDADEGSASRLAADLLVGFADEGTLPMEADPAEELAGELMLMQASETVNNPEAPPEAKGEAAAVIGERAIKQLAAKQEAESDLAAMSNADDLAKRIVERWADGKGQGEIGEELRAGGWDYSKADKRMFDRLEQEVEILMDEGEFARAKSLTFARLNLMKNGGAPDANVTPYDEFLDKYIEADAANMTAGQAFSIAGTDAFLSTIRGIGRITGMGYTTPHDKDLLEKMTASAYQEHPISSLAGSFTGGFLDPVFFGVSMAAAKAPITAAQRSRYVQGLMAKGTTAEVAEQLGKKATLETIASARLTNYFLKQGLSLKASQAAGRLVWNISDAAVVNAAAEGIVAAGEGESPTDIGIRAVKGAAMGVVMGAALDRAFAGIGKVSQALTGKVPKATGGKLDAAISYAAADPDGAALGRELRNLTAAWDDASRRLGRRLTTEEAEGIASGRGVNLDELVDQRARQKQELKGKGNGDQVEAKTGGDLSEATGMTALEREGVERGIIKAPEPEPTPEQRRQRDEQAERELQERYGPDLEAYEQGIVRDAPPEPDKAERARRKQAADEELQRRYGPGLDAEEQRAGKRIYPARVTADELAEIEAPSADMGPDATPEDIAASAKFQRGNIEALDHRDEDFVKVYVPIEELDGIRTAGGEADVDQYAQMDPESRPPIAAGPPKAGELAQGKTMLVADGQRRAAAARANKETEIAAYVPGWFAQEREYPTAPGRLRGIGEGGIVTDRTPGGFGPNPQEPAPLPTPEELDQAFEGGPQKGGPQEPAPLPTPEEVDRAFKKEPQTPKTGKEKDAFDRHSQAMMDKLRFTREEADKTTGFFVDYIRERDARGVLGFVNSPADQAIPLHRRFWSDMTGIKITSKTSKAETKRIVNEWAAKPQGEADADTRPRPAERSDEAPAPAVPDARDAKGPRTNQRPPPPAIAPAFGGDLRVKVPGRSEPLRGRYAIVEADDLIPSHDARQGYHPNKYGDLNERPYNDPTEGKALRARVGEISENIDPDFLLSNTPTAVDGPPIVNPDLVVLGGNARTMAQQLAYSRGGGYAGGLAQATRQRASMYGIGGGGLSQFKNPVLVRVLNEADAGAPGELSRLLNESFTSTRTSDSDAASLSRNIDDAASLSIARLMGDGTLGEAFNNPARSSQLQSALVKSGAYNPSDLNRMMDQRGLFNQQARREIENTLLAVAVPDIRRMAELSPAMRSTLIRSLPALTTLRASGIDGRDFTEILGNALDIVKERRATNAASIDDLLTQSSMMPQPWRGDEQALLLARAMESDKPTTLSDRFTSMAAVAGDDLSGQGRMFDDDPAQGFNDIFGPRSNIGGGTERQAPKGITGRSVDDIAGVPGDQMRLTRDNAGPQSGVTPGVERQTPPAWITQPAKTRAGKRIVGRIKSDKQGMRYGVRSIAESLTNTLDGLMVRQTREQTSKRSPAHFMDHPHMVRTRSASEPNWMFHEQGHAISAIVREANPKFIKDFKAELNELALWPGSMASKNSAEEGFAEFIRRQITDPARMEKWPATARIMAAMESANPTITEAVRDAARAFDAYMQRPLEARWRSYMTDTKSAPGGVKRVLARGLVDYVSRGFAPELATRRVMVEVRKDAKTMREGWAAVEKIEKRLANTSAEMQPAYQSLNHIGQMVNIALEGPGKVKAGVPTGMRVHATIIPENLAGGFFDRAGGDKATPPGMLSASERKALTDAGFRVPDEPDRHGDIVILADKSIADAIKPIPKDQWAAFETYAQMKATYARIKARAMEGEGFPFQTQGEGAKPADLNRSVLKAEKANPAWSKVFGDLEEIMNSTLLLDVMSGELTAGDAIKLKNRFEHYIPLTRQGEGGPRGIHSGASTAPSANIRRSRGAVNPAEPLLMAMARKVDEAVNAYYWNRFAMSPIILSQSLQAMKDVPRSAKVAASRMGIPLHLDRKKIATATPEEVRKQIYEYIVDRVRAGSDLFNILPEELASFTPEDIGIVDGFDIWRAQAPKAVNVLAPNIGGRRHYFQVLDENLYRIFAEGGENANTLARISEAAFGSTTQGLKNQITQTFEFTMRNLFRDSLTGVLFGRDPVALVPGFYHAVGALSMLTGRKPDSLISPELLSRVFRQVTPEDFAKQRSKMMEILTEGLVPRGWRDMNALHKTLSAPGIAARVLMKPAEIKLIVTGQRWLASTSETAPRLGAYIAAKHRGMSDEAAQLAADTVTGNFAERPLNASAHSIYRTAGFLNPAMQIFGQQVRFFTDPVPARSAAKAATRIGAIASATAGAWALKRLLSTPEDLARDNERTEQERITHMDIKGLRIPFDYGITGGVQSYVWNTLDELAGARGVSDAQIARKIVTEIFPHTSLNPLELAPMPLKAGTEAAMGYSLYRGETLEPPYMQYIEPSERYFDSTPDLYRWVGKMAGTSPIKAQYFVRNGLGVQVDNAVKLLDRIDEGFEVDELASLPEIGRMFSREPIGWNSRSVRDAAEISDRYDHARRRAKRMAEDPTNDPAALAEVIAILDKLQPVKDAMLEVQKLYDLSKDARDHDDPDAARELKRKMVEIARDGLIRMQEADQATGGTSDE